MVARRKAVILGIDGADFAYCSRWIRKGLTPTLADLAARGRIGILQSTYPPVTAPAWISLMTGQQPGSHGIVGFAAPSTGEYARKVVNSTSFDAPTIWEVAGRHGADCLVVNVPLTYPVRPLRGTLVSGLLTPEGASFTYPPEFQAELAKEIPGYVIDVYWQPYRGRGEDLVRDVRSMTRMQAELCVKLLATKPWDFFMVVFTGTDRLQHCLHEHVMALDDDDAVRRDPLTAAVREYIVDLDARLGEIVRAAGEDANVLVVSDHGFGPLEASIYFNKWLAEEGLLSLRSASAGATRLAWKRALNAIGVRRSTFTALGRAVGLGAAVEKQVQRLNPFVGGIDWENTTVFYHPTNGFFVNLKGREMFGVVEPGDAYEGVRADLIRRLEAMRDPRDGSRLIPFVKRREEVFAGRNLDRLPDVFIEFFDRPYDAFMQEYDVPSVFMKSGWGNGTHRRNGLYIGAGPALVRGGEVQGLEIFDVAPNVLHLLGLPVPAHMDGRLREDLFAEDAREGMRVESFEGHGAARSTITPEEEQDLQEKLRGLGYL
jgi:predicted AlkP superfamily phosphohydrolase/phosphomutase